MPDTTSSPMDVVRSFFADAGAEGAIAAYQRWIAPDCVVQSCGRPGPHHGIDALIALERQGQAELGYDHWTVEMRAAAVVDDAVLTHRIDRLINPDGSVLVELEVMGSLRVRDGRIVEWRDFFDKPALEARLHAATA